MSAITVTITSAGRRIDPTYELAVIDIIKEVNRIPTAQLMLVDGDVTKSAFPISDTPDFEPGKEIEIKLRYEGDPDTPVFKGVVTRHKVEVDDQGPLLSVDLKDAAIKLTLARKNAVYRKQTDDKIIGKIIGDNGLKKGEIVATKPEHAEIVQYYCTDWDFMLSRAEAHGQLVVVDDGSLSLHDIEISGSPKHTFELGLSEIFNFEIEVDASDQLASVESIAWDIKTQKLTKAHKAKAVNLAPGNLKGDTVATAIGAEASTLTAPVPLAPEELQAWADASLARSRLALVRGRFSVPGLAAIKLLDVLRVAGVGDRFNGSTLVTGIRHRIDAQGWHTDVQFGLSAERFAARPDIADLPAAGLLPAVHGLHIGIVDAFAEDPDNQFRVKVILPGIDAKTGAVWARLASPDAGKERGFFFRPEKGDEVVVGFFNDDPRQAVILGAMHSGKNPPPKDMSELTKDNIDKGIVTKTGTAIHFKDDEKASLSITTPEANTIVLNDDTQTIQIEDQHGNAITMSENGIVIKSAKDVKIDASGNVEIKGKKVEVK